MKTIRRNIKYIATYHNKGYEKHWAVGGHLRFTLDECGHTQVRKLSQGVPMRVRCKECERVRDGVTGMTKIGDGLWTKQVWDKERGIPVTVEVQE